MLTSTSMPSTTAFSPAAPSPTVPGQPLPAHFSLVTERPSRPPSPASMVARCCRAQLVTPDRQKRSPQASVLVYPWAAPRDGNSSIDVPEAWSSLEKYCLGAGTSAVSRPCGRGLPKAIHIFDRTHSRPIGASKSPQPRIKIGDVERT